MKDNTELRRYATDALGGASVYDEYLPRSEVLARVAALLPRAHVVVVSAGWCPDCRSTVPKFARIAEHLPGWTFELRGDDEQTRGQLAVRAIPTFVVQDGPGGRELGRIVEHGETGSLEGDLLAIAQRAAASVA